MIGVDLINLREARKSKHLGSERYFRKICNEKEQRRFAFTSQNALFQILIWSLKEAVYKADPMSERMSFNPHTIEVLLFDDQQFETISLVRFGKRKYSVDTYFFKGNLISIARKQSHSGISCISYNPEQESPSLRLISGKPIMANNTGFFSRSHHGHNYVSVSCK